MIVLQIDGPLFDVPLTVDSTLITVDTTLITADATIFNSYPYKIKVTPAFSSSDFRIQFKNEVTDEISNLSVDYYYYIGDELIVYFDKEFKEGDSFEVKYFDNITNKLMYRDRALATEQNDIENYQLSPKNNNTNIIKY